METPAFTSRPEIGPALRSTMARMRRKGVGSPEARKTAKPGRSSSVWRAVASSRSESSACGSAKSRRIPIHDGERFQDLGTRLFDLARDPGQARPFRLRVSLVATGYLAWRLLIRANTLHAAGETTAQLKIKLGYLAYSMSILMALTAVALFVVMLRPPQRSVPGEGGTTRSRR